MKTAKEIIRETATDHGISVADLRGPCRLMHIAHARFDAMARLRAVTMADGSHRFSTTHIGKMLGGRHHTTVLNGLRRWKQINLNLQMLERAA